MKKIILLLVAVIATTLGAKAQTVTMPFYYGTNQTIGLGVNVVTQSNLLIGGGMSVFVGKGGAVGTDYSNVFGPNAFKEDVYEITTSKNISVYGTIGYNFKNFIVGSKIGYGTKSTHYNSYDNYQILSPSGYYHVSESAGGEFLVGGFVTYMSKSIISPFIGYDNFNGGIIGISVDFF